MQCTCQNEFFESSTSSSGDDGILSVSENFTVTEVCVLDFGKVPVGKQVTKTLKLRNETDRQKTIKFKRDPRPNPIYHCFELDVYEKTVAPNVFFEVNVTYLCTIPHKKNYDYFNIHTTSGGLGLKVTLKAESIGPSINASATCLYFHKFTKSEMKRNILELKNNSKVDAVFQFDLNETQQDVFVVKPIRGTIPANDHIFIEVSYMAKVPGQHFSKLFCLIHYHETIVIEAIGVYSLQEDVNPANLRFMHYPQPYEETIGSLSYLSDSLKVRTSIPPVSLSENTLDFGRVLPVEAYNRICTVNNCLTLVTSLTNHTDNQIEIIWEKDCNNVFSLSPQRVIIPKKCSVLFECQFYPTFQDQFYFKILTAQILWMNLNPPDLQASDLCAPLSISIRLLGHSFPENTGWIPRVEVPINIIVPSTLPTFPTRNTFLLQAKGHLPVLYKFLPPRNSVFIIKPMAGIIRQYQIIIVQLQTVTKKNSACIEQWELELNGQHDRKIQVYFKGQVEFPSVIVGNSNFIKFDCTHPGCQGIKRESFRNDISYPLSYKFVVETHQPYLNIEPSCGEIQSNEVIYLDWYFLSSFKGPNQLKIKCELRAMRNGTETIGLPYETFVTVTSECSYSELCAIPKSHSFGNLQFNSEVETSFTIFNFGKSPLHVVLEYPKIEELKRSTISISPLVGSVAYKEKWKINIQLKIKDPGFYRIQIYYLIRLNEISDVLINPDEKKEIFSFDFECSYPILQITEILDNNFGPLFSKQNLWELLNIDQINLLLKSMGDNETQIVGVSVPDMEMQDQLYKAVMRVKNFSDLDETVIIKKEQKCDCKAVPIAVSMTRRKLVFDCNHRLMCNLYLDNETVKANSTAILTLELNYLLPGITKIHYLLKLSHERVIMLYINIRSLPKSVKSVFPSKYTKKYEINFDNVYLLEKDPMAKGFWFYNNTAVSTQYEVALKAMEGLKDLGTLRCINPVGMIQAYWALPLIFQFIPSNTEHLYLEVPVHFEKNVVIIKINANGSLTYKPIKTTPEKRIDAPMPSKPCIINPQYIDIPFMTVWSQAQKLIFVRNQSEKREYSFLFQVGFIEGIAKVNAWPAVGIIPPGQTRAVTLNVTSFDIACEIQINISCKFLDETQRRQHETALQTYYMHMSTSGGSDLSEVSIITPQPDPIYQTVAVHVKVLSVYDRDLHLSVSQQKILTPQIDIRLNSNEIIESVKHGSRYKSQTYKKLHEEINLKRIPHFENTIYTLLKDAVYSSFFTNVVQTLMRSPPAYYVQHKVVMQHVKRRSSATDLQEYARKGTNESENIRRFMMTQFLKRPQSYILAKVFQQLIYESVCEVFKLNETESKND